MIIKTKAGSGASTASTNSGDWDEVKFYLNGLLVLNGASLVLSSGKENIITVEAAGITNLRLGLADAGNMKLVAIPEFGSLLPLVGSAFQCTITPATDQSGSGVVVFYSSEIDSSIEFVLEVVAVLFTFEKSTGFPLPIPPNIYQLAAGTPVERIVAYLRNSKDLPLANVSGTFFHPDMADFPFTTSPSGRVHVFVQNNGYPVGRIFTVRAVAKLPGGDLVKELIVEIL